MQANFVKTLLGEKKNEHSLLLHHKSNSKTPLVTTRFPFTCHPRMFLIPFTITTQGDTPEEA